MNPAKRGGGPGSPKTGTGHATGWMACPACGALGVSGLGGYAASRPSVVVSAWAWALTMPASSATAWASV